MAEASRLRVVRDERDPEAGREADGPGLPVRRGPLFGREREVERARALLDEHVGPLTLTGPGGVGKTRLALRVAVESAAAFADGVCFVSLAPLGDPTLVGPTVAQALGLPERGGQPPLARLVAHLREKHLLLVLDNCEQVLPAAPLVADLLAACPRLAVLATSRAALRLSGERELLVPPLAVPEPRQWTDPDALTRSAAVALFVARARAVKDDFRLTAANGPVVAEICHRLDGLPLAIELAAARVRTLPPQALLPRLGQRLALLTGGAHDLPARQQTLRRTIEWSHNLLGPGERALFARLAVFVGGRTLEAIEAVCGATSDERRATSGDAQAAGDPAVPAPLDVLDGLDALVGQSLLRQEEGPGGEPRFVMLATIHEFARECLAASGEEEALRRRHAAYFLAFAEGIASSLYGPDHGALLDRLERDGDNLRAALAWLVGCGDAARAVRLESVMQRLWEVRGYHVEGRARSAEVLALARRTEALPPSSLAQALYVAGSLAMWREGGAVARALHEEEVALRRALGDERGTAPALTLLATLDQDLGDFAAARARFEEVVAVARRYGDDHRIALATINLGHVAYSQGDLATARARYEESLPLFEQLGDLQRVARAYEVLGRVAHREGDHAAAQQALERGLAGFRAVGYRSGIADTLHNLGILALDRGNLLATSAYFTEALTLAAEMTDRELAQLLHGVARLALALGEPAVALRLLSAATHLGERAGTILPLLEVPDHERALADARRALGTAEAERAWVAGHTLALDEILAEARRVAGLVPDPAAAMQAARPQGAPLPSGLTAREVEVLRLVAQGLTDAQVATRLYLSPRTVGQHLRSVYNKLGVENRAAATRFAVEHHLA